MSFVSLLLFIGGFFVVLGLFLVGFAMLVKIGRALYEWSEK